MSPTKADLEDVFGKSDELESDDLEVLDEEPEEAVTEEQDQEVEEGSEEETEEEPEEEKEEEAEVEKKTAKELEAGKVERKLTKELEGILAQLGKDETLKSQGLEVKLSDFTPKELRDFMQKGFRFYQHMQELSEKEGRLARTDQQLREAAIQIQSLQSQIDSKLKSMAFTGGQETTMPKDLEIDEAEDTPDVVMLKKTAQAQWKHNRSLVDRIDQIEGGFQQQASASRDAELRREVDLLASDYPTASKEEALAVYMLSTGQIPMKKIMERGEQIYGSVDFVHKVFEHHPEVRKAIFDEMTKEYHVRLKKAANKRLPVKQVGTGTKVVAPGKKKELVTFSNVGSKILKDLKRKQAELEEEI